jgi:hypothetical protein
MKPIGTSTQAPNMNIISMKGSIVNVVRRVCGFTKGKQIWT